MATDCEWTKKKYANEQERKSHKPVLEKKRRQRINKSLEALKSLLLDAVKSDGAHHSKLEKADILEMTVKHLKDLQRKQLNAAMSVDPTVLRRYQSGFVECSAEVRRYLGTIDGGIPPEVKHRLVDHLNGCTNNINDLSTTTHHVISSSSSSACAPPPTPLPVAQLPAASPMFAASAASQVLDIKPLAMQQQQPDMSPPSQLPAPNQHQAAPPPFYRNASPFAHEQKQFPQPQQPQTLMTSHVQVQHVHQQVHSVYAGAQAAQAAHAHHMAIKQQQQQQHGLVQGHRVHASSAFRPILTRHNVHAQPEQQQQTPVRSMSISPPHVSPIRTVMTSPVNAAMTPSTNQQRSLNHVDMLTPNFRNYRPRPLDVAEVSGVSNSSSSMSSFELSSTVNSSNDTSSTTASTSGELGSKRRHSGGGADSVCADDEMTPLAARSRQQQQQQRVSQDSRRRHRRERAGARSKTRLQSTPLPARRSVSEQDTRHDVATPAASVDAFTPAIQTVSLKSTSRFSHSTPKHACTSSATTAASSTASAAAPAGSHASDRHTIENTDSNIDNKDHDSSNKENCPLQLSYAASPLPAAATAAAAERDDDACHVNDDHMWRPW